MNKTSRYLQAKLFATLLLALAVLGLAPGAAFAVEGEAAARVDEAVNAVAEAQANEAAAYEHSNTVTSGSATFTVYWNDMPAGEKTVFHVELAGGGYSLKRVCNSAM